MVVAKLIRNGLEVKLKYNGKIERLAADNYPSMTGSDSLFVQFSAFYLVCPHLPKVIEADFNIDKPIIDIINKMYALEKKSKPKIMFDTASDEIIMNKTFPKTSNIKIVVSYSGGKDSMWNLWWAQEKYGVENVLAVHIEGLNRANASDEKKYSIIQSQKLGFDMDIMKLHNGSSVTGYTVNRLRDIFMVGILSPYALTFGASSVIIEGFGSQRETLEEQNLGFFNKKLTEMGVNVHAEWRNHNRMDSVKDIYEHRPDWMPEVCNCFSPKCYKPGIRRSWEKRTPTFKLYDSQCGSCVKCRTINIGRILHDPSLDANVNDIKYYIKSTEKWYVNKLETHSDMISRSFLKNLQKAAKMYDVELKRL